MKTNSTLQKMVFPIKGRSLLTLLKRNRYMIVFNPFGGRRRRKKFKRNKLLFFNE